MCENESIRNRRSVGSFGVDFFDGMVVFDDKLRRRRVTRTKALKGDKGQEKAVRF
jgi:hypothetical protein